MNAKPAALLSTLVGVLLLLTSALALPTVYPHGVTIHEEGIAEGYVLFRGDDRRPYLIDADGTVVHTWSALAGKLGPIRALENGHVLYATGGALTELDWAGTVVWEFSPPSGVLMHHDWERLPDGNSLILCRQTVYEPSISDKDIIDDMVLVVSPGGDVVWEWHTVEHFEEFGFSPERRAKIYDRGGDWSHINTVSSIPDNTSHSDPRFSPGNIIISVRHQNTIAVIDRVTSQVVWVLTDSTIGQHTPHMLTDDLSGGGKILVFDNGNTGPWTMVPNRYYSRVLEIDPVSGSTSNVYTADFSGLPTETFFSSFMSGAQRLSNDNILIVESKWGRIFEVTDSGQLVWEYLSPYLGSANENTVYRASKVPLDWAAPHFVPDLVVSGAGDPDPVETGGDLHYTIEVENTGADPAVDVTLVQSTPSGTRFQSIAAPAGWSCATPAVGATGPINCTSRTIGSGAEAVITIVVGVDLCDPDLTTITHTATVSSEGTDANPVDNSTLIETDVGPNTTLVQDLVAGLVHDGVDLRLAWGDWGPTCGYRVLRSTAPSDGFTDVSDVILDNRYLDSGAGISPNDYYYLVEIDRRIALHPSRGACGLPACHRIPRAREHLGQRLQRQRSLTRTMHEAPTTKP